MEESVKKAFESMGLRTYEDPEAKRRANEEADLNLNLTIRNALFINAATQLMIGLTHGTPELASKFAEGFFELYPEGEAREFLRISLEEIQKELFKEIYRKQREIYSGVDH